MVLLVEIYCDTFLESCAQSFRPSSHIDGQSRRRYDAPTSRTTVKLSVKGYGSKNPGYMFQCGRSNFLLSVLNLSGLFIMLNRRTSLRRFAIIQPYFWLFHLTTDITYSVSTSPPKLDYLPSWRIYYSSIVVNCEVVLTPKAHTPPAGHLHSDGDNKFVLFVSLVNSRVLNILKMLFHM